VGEVWGELGLGEGGIGLRLGRKKNHRLESKKKTGEHRHGRLGVSREVVGNAVQAGVINWVKEERGLEERGASAVLKKKKKKKNGRDEGVGNS